MHKFKVRIKFFCIQVFALASLFVRLMIKAVVTIHDINLLFFEMDTRCVFCDTGTESLKVVEIKLRLPQFKICDVEIPCIAARKADR